MATPGKIYDYDILTKEKKLVNKVEIPSGHKNSDYKVERIKAKSHDGRMIPITLVRRKDIELNGKSNSTIKWNFQKYIVDAKGELINYFFSNTKPMSPKIISIIKQ